MFLSKFPLGSWRIWWLACALAAPSLSSTAQSQPTANVPAATSSAPDTEHLLLEPDPAAIEQTATPNPAAAPVNTLEPPVALPAQPTPQVPAVPVAAGPKVRPLWTELTPLQQQALLPLSTQWDSLNTTQKRKWLVLSKNFYSLPSAERDKLHSRMTEWAAMSVEQRNQARMNFAVTQKIAPDDKRAQWEAYQALSPEEKQKLASGVAPRPTGAAMSIKPAVGQQKIVAVPKKPVQPHASDDSTIHTLLPAPAVPPTTTTP